MEYLLNSKQMKMVDEYSIKRVGIPSIVLMERAAYTVSELIKARAFVAYAGVNPAVATVEAYDDSPATCMNGTGIAKVLCVCGRGNNGADGLAVARHLMQAGCSVTIECVGDEQGIATEEFNIQKNILLNMGADFRKCVQMAEYDYIVDAIFGVGLSREVSGEYAQAIERINRAKELNNHIMVVAVDVASGINATDGKVMGVAVKADETVTFGYKKLGMVMNPGAGYSGNILVTDIGFVQAPLKELGGAYVAYTYDLADVTRLPKRSEAVNKGDCGKVLVVAGSADMGGAAFMSSAAAYRSGAGLVKVFTHSNNRDLLLKYVPEAVPLTYGDELAETDIETLKRACKWADCIVIGPGLSQSEMSKKIFDVTLKNCGDASVVIDADGLNILAAKKGLSGVGATEVSEEYNFVGTNVIITPHIGEMSRITGKSIEEIKDSAIDVARETAKELSVMCVLKDARTIVTDGDKVYVNTTGNSGMATAGSGDVLTGILAGMLTAGFKNTFDAVTMGVNVHACSGDMCKTQLGSRGMKAWDLVETLPRVYKIAE